MDLGHGSTEGIGPVRQLCHSKGLGGAEEHVRVLKMHFGNGGRHWRVLHSHLPKSDVSGFCRTRLFGRGTGWVVTVHGKYQRWRGRVVLPAVYKAWSSADKVIAISEEVRRWLVEKGIPRGKVVVIHYGVRVGPIGRPRPNGGMVIGTIARLEPRKGLDRVIKALPKILQRHPGTTFQIVGRDERGYRKDLLRLCDELSVREHVGFVGEVPHEKISDWFDGIDVYVQPSREEGLGLAVLEAMAHGKAIVVSKIPAFREVVPFWQRLTPPDDWANRIDWKLRGSPGFRHRQGMALREHVEKNFSLSEMLWKVRGVYAEVQSG